MTLRAKGCTFASLSLSKGRVSVGGVSSALGGSVGEDVWSVALASDLVRERSLDIFVSETVTVAIGNRLFYRLHTVGILTKNYAEFKSSYESLSFRFDKNGVA